MASALLDLTTIAAAASEREALVQLNHVLQRPRDGAVVMVIDGEKVEVPPAVLQLLGECVRALVHNRAVTLLPRPRQLTTQEAADLLNVSRPYLEAVMHLRP